MNKKELIVSLYEYTSTVSIMNCFEGYEDYATDDDGYQHIVIANALYRLYIYDAPVWVNLVIERCDNPQSCVGNVTITDIKMRKADALENYINLVITQNDIKEYLDKDAFYRFARPFLIRAKNEGNMTGFGWNGTHYGDTTNYCCAGVYISSNYTYEPTVRIPKFKPRDWKVEI